MEYLSFCILNDILYLCTSDLSSLLALLKYRGLDIDRADQGRIHHINPDDYLIICPEKLKVVVEKALTVILKGNLIFKGADNPIHNNKIYDVEYLLISDSIYINVPNLVMEEEI